MRSFTFIMSKKIATLNFWPCPTINLLTGPTQTIIQTQTFHVSQKSDKTKLCAVLPSIAASSKAMSWACAWEKEGAGEPLLSDSSADRPSGVKVCETTLGFLAAKPLLPRADASRLAPAPISLRATGCGLEGCLMSDLSEVPDLPRAKNSPAGVAWAAQCTILMFTHAGNLGCM